MSPNDLLDENNIFAKYSESTIHNKHNYRINKDEWNEVNATLIISNNERNVYLQSIKERIDWGLKAIRIYHRSLKK